jgi:superfamily II DNA or RNA helicase
MASTSTTTSTSTATTTLSFVLRPEQQRVFDQLPRDRPMAREPQHNAIIHAATSWGKTLVALRAIENVFLACRGTPQRLIVFIAPTVLLVQQQARYLKEKNSTDPPMRVGEIYGGMQGPAQAGCSVPAKCKWRPGMPEGIWHRALPLLLHLDRC